MLNKTWNDNRRYSDNSAGMQALAVAGGVGAVLIAGAMALAAIAAMIWAVVTGVLGTALILSTAWVAVRFRESIERERVSTNVRAVEELARLQVLYGPPVVAPAVGQVIDARALPPGGQVLVNGQPYQRKAGKVH